MKIAGLFLALMILTIGSVYPAETGFKKIDTNRDGKVDEGEVGAAVENKFNKYDRNRDGVVDSKEFNPKKDPQLYREFKFIDKDGNKRLDLDEFKAAAMERFRAFDYNHDSAVSAPEYRAKEAYPILRIYF